MPTADFWYLRDGKIETFDCYVGYSVMFAQMGVMPDFASAVAEPAAGVAEAEKRAAQAQAEGAP